MERFQRHFLIPFSTVPSRDSKALCGQSRADVLCRCVVNGLMISADTRNDTCVACVLLGTADLEPATLLCCGQHMRALQPTERTVAGILQVTSVDEVACKLKVPFAPCYVGVSTTTQWLLWVSSNQPMA